MEAKRMIVDFNQGWKFRLSGQRKEQEVDLPHDAMLYSKRDPKSLGGAGIGFFSGGVYIYKKNFEAPEEWKGKHITFLFEGVYRNAEVTINGKKAGGFHYGYSSFDIIADSLLKYGEDNEIIVKADNKDQPNSRFYTGGGIYRPVHLLIQEKERFIPHLTRVKTIHYTPAEVEINIPHEGGEVYYEILNPDKKKVFSSNKDSETVKIPNASFWDDVHPSLYTLKAYLKKDGKVIEEERVRFGIRLLSWSGKGFFVNGKQKLLRGGCIHSDNGILGACSYEEAEYRKAKLLKEAGFNLIRSAHNPMSDYFLTACDELGIYVMDELSDMWYKAKNPFDYSLNFMEEYPEVIKRMVQKDFNHPSVVMYSIGNEVTEPAEKKGVDLAKDLTQHFHEEDNSRPTTAGINISLLLMEAGRLGLFKQEMSKDAVKENEVPKDEKEAQGDKLSSQQFMDIMMGKIPVNSTTYNMITNTMAQRMEDACKVPFADGFCTPLFDNMDIAGYNYASGRYEIDRDLHPDRLIIGSETLTGSLYKNWSMVKNNPNVIGDCMWTAMDYLGEAGCGAWAYEADGTNFNKPYPWLLADDGALDLTGHLEAQGGYTKTVWGYTDKPLIYVRPVNHDNEPTKSAWRFTNAIDSWSWKGWEGKPATIEVFSFAPFVKLEINGKEVGIEKVEGNKAMFHATYEPGILKAVDLNEDKTERREASLVSAQGKLKLFIKSEKEQFRNGEVAFFEVLIEDDNRQVESNADTLIQAEIENGKILGMGSAQARTEDKYYEGKCHTYYGRALLAAKVFKGVVKIKVTGEGFEKPGTLTLNIH